MYEGHDQAIHDLLRERGSLATANLDAAREIAQTSGRSLADCLVAQGTITAAGLFSEIASATGHRFEPTLPSILPGEAIAALPAALVHRFGVAPLAAATGTIRVAAADPFNFDLAAELGFVLERTVEVCVADPVRLEVLIKQHYGETRGPLVPAAEEAPPILGSGQEDRLSETDLHVLAETAPVIRVVDAVLSRAVVEGASDVHFEPFEHEFRIRYRVDGTLRELPAPARQFALPVISRLKVLANLNIAERRVPQDGRIHHRVGGRVVDLRLSTLPTQFGESVVLRVLDQSAVRLSLGELGLPAAVRAALETAIRRPNGIVVVTGPTGAGKTTTLYACVQALNRPDAKLLTIEDPVEYEIYGIMQVPVHAGSGLTFARALRAFLRQDPDIVMVGEIRDLETAQIAIQAALTGHLVLTTLHTNDAASAVTRLLDLGVEPFLVASALEGVLAQRLLKRICPACRQAVPLDTRMADELGLADCHSRPVFVGRGCGECAQTGYRGRLGIFEFLPVSESLRERIVAGDSLDQLRVRPP